MRFEIATLFFWNYVRCELCHIPNVINKNEFIMMIRVEFEEISITISIKVEAKMFGGYMKHLLLIVLVIQFENEVHLWIF